MSSRNRYKKFDACTVAIETFAKSVGNWKELSNLILDIFQISRQPRRIRKNRNHQIFCWCRHCRGIFL